MGALFRLGGCLVGAAGILRFQLWLVVCLRLKLLGCASTRSAQLLGSCANWQISLCVFASPRGPGDPRLWRVYASD